MVSTIPTRAARRRCHAARRPSTGGPEPSSIQCLDALWMSRNMANMMLQELN